jgi:hypothetical protein
MVSSEDAGATAAKAEGPSLRRAAILTARLGIVQAILLLVSVWLLTYIPDATASDAELVAFYESADRRLAVLVGLYLMPFAAIAFLWFAVALRMWAERSTAKIDVLLSNVQLFSAIVFITLLLAGAAASTVPAITMELGTASFDPTSAREFPQFGSALLVVLSMRLAAMFVFTTSSITRRHGLLPRWFAVTGFAVGLILLLSASLNPLLVLVFPSWVLVLSVLLLLRARQMHD